MADVPTAVLERRLHSAAEALELDAIDVVSAVMSRLPVRRLPVRRRPLLLRPAFAFSALMLVAIAVVLIVPSTRDATARWFGLDVRAVEVRFEEFPTAVTVPVTVAPTAPPVSITSPETSEVVSAPATTQPLAGDLFGTPDSAADAVARTGLDVPVIAALGQPDAVYVDERAEGGAIVAVYASSATIPSAAVDGIGAIVEVLRGHVDRPIYLKFVAGGTSVTETKVGTSDAFFVSGEPHLVAYVDAAGEPIQDSARLAGNTLLWDVGELTFRLETSLDLATAVELAESLATGT